MRQVESRIHAPRVNPDILSQRLEYTRDFPEYEVQMAEAVFPTMKEAVSLLRDLETARAELEALASMVIFGSIKTVDLAYDIQLKYGWGATDK